MGQQVSTVQDVTARINGLSLDVFPEIDKYTLRKHLDLSNDQQVLESIGVSSKCTGADLLHRSATFLASYPNSMSERASIPDNIFKVIGFYNQKLTRALKLSSDQYVRLLFLSLAVQSQEVAMDLKSVDASKYYIQFTDLVELVALLSSVYDKDPTVQFEVDVSLAFKQVAQRMLEPFKAPIIDYNAFVAFVDRFPYLFNSFQILWDQLLYEQTNESKVLQKQKIPEMHAGNAAQAHHEAPKSSPLAATHEVLKTATKTILKPQDICLLYFTRGPEVLNAIKLYHARSDGFSMRAFESKVVNWKAPSIAVIRGKRLTKSVPELDKTIPRVTDTSERDSKWVLFAIYVDAAWKISNKRGFARGKTTIYQLEPQFSIFNTNAGADESGIGYFSPDLGGIGMGLSPPQSKTIHFHRAANVALVIDRFLEHGVFRCVGDNGTFAVDDHLVANVPYEDRFSISSVEVWGIGDLKVLAAQQREWDWERREVQRRQNVQIGEDRAILEMAGIVGQYDPNRGTS